MNNFKIVNASGSINFTLEGTLDTIQGVNCIRNKNGVISFIQTSVLIIVETN
jgi:hypothetical protein